MSEAAGAHCPTCNGANPLGAKFCSACRAPLVAAAPASHINPAPPPPPAPPRPGIGGMMGQMGGKSVMRQVSGEAAAVYAEISRYVRNLPSTEMQHELPPQQLSAKVAYKDLLATGGIVIAVDTSITVAPTSPGQCQVSVTTKTDMSSTNKIWLYNMFFAACGLFLLWWPLLLALLVLGAVSSFWLLSTSPGQNISNQLFAHLTTNATKLNNSPEVTPGPVAPTPLASTPAAPQPATPTPAPAPAPEADANPAEDEIFVRLKKLAELRDAGAISAEDFETKKSDLLARI